MSFKHAWTSMVLALGGAALCMPAHAQEPYNEDEWYDPTDWFDGNNEEWDDTYEWWDEGRDDAYGYDAYRYDAYDRDPYDYDSSYNDYDYGWHYEWDPYANRWDYVYGWHDETYEDATDSSYGDDYGWHRVWDPGQDSWDWTYGWHDNTSMTDPDADYGWHYEWDRAERRWERVYGWHDETYDFDPYRYTPAQDRGQRRRAQDSQRRSSMRDAEFSGRIESFKRVDLAGQPDDHTLIRLRTRDGSTRIVDMGPRLEPSDIELEPGDTIRVRGRRASISGRDVLKVSAFTVDGERTQVRSRARSSQDDAQRSRDRARFSGELESSRRVSLRNRPDDHLLVRMRLEDGTSRVVDFGPTTRFSELDLDQGDRVQIEGRKTTSDGRTVIVAEKVRLEGARFPMERGRMNRDRMNRGQQRRGDMNRHDEGY